MTDSEYGIQPDGSLRRPHVDELRDRLERTFKNAAGENIELNQGSPQQQIIDMAAQEFAHHWMALEEVYYAGFFQDASGEALDKQLALAGFTRIPSRSATGEVVFSRESPAPDDITIPAKTVVTTRRTETRPQIPFETAEEVILSEGDTEVTASIEALKPWQSELNEEWLGEETNVTADSITRFDDLVGGIDDVTNPNPTGDEALGYVEGRDRETDAEFKLRYENSLAEGGSSTIQAIKSNVFNADEDVRSVRVDEVRDPDTGYGVNVIVLAPGVPDGTIAQAIVDSRAGGLESFGAESGVGLLDDGTEKTEAFDRATEQTIYADADVTTSSTFPADGREQIENGIIRYIGGTATDGILYPGLEIGEDVIHDQVKRRVMEIQGVVEADVQIDTADPPAGTANIVIGDDATAMTGTDAVDITEV
jgi:uncharacterized phage protein gp47/JayE